MGCAVLAFSLFVLSAFSLISVEGNPTCPSLKKEMINVHLICHTHDDVGWLKTVEQYYYGARKRITWVGVQYILDSVIESLAKDPKRKFIYVESAFFFRWWDEQNEAKKSLVKKLVSNGQLEFINGGWCMNDEAAAHYNAIIDQMTLGLTRLNDTFGKAAFPRIAWQIDPFGHSREQANLFAQMGMDGFFFGRLDHDDKDHRWRKKQMELIWSGSDSLGEKSWIFTGILPRNYSPPKDFCFDLLCADDPIMDNPKLEEYNVNEKITKFLNEVKEQTNGYKTSNLIMTMGEDFDYVNAESWYKNLDKLIKYVNEMQSNGSKVNLVYSTPSCYLDALYESNSKWPYKNDDFFPYSSDPHAYWTGYFTSRPAFKAYVRKANNILQSVKQISALSNTNLKSSFGSLSDAMGIAQHHDAITGTAKQHVSDDYTKRLSVGIDQAYQAIDEGLRKLTKLENNLSEVSRNEFCPLLNISSCPFSERQTEPFIVTVYNPLAHFRSHYVRIPVSHKLIYKITNSKGDVVTGQLVPVPNSVKKIPERESTAEFELVFYAENLPPLGHEQFHLRPTKNPITAAQQMSFERTLNHGGDIVVSKGFVRVTFDKESHLLKAIGYAKNKTDIPVSQNWYWYAGMAGDNSEFAKRASGAYIFRPNGTLNRFQSKVNITGIYEGKLVTEVHQKWNAFVSQVIRLYKKRRNIEIEWLIGPIPVEDKIGKEIVNRISFKNMDTKKVFYTDSNGRQLIKRVKDYRPSWPFVSTEPVSQNYYPITSKIVLTDYKGKEKAALLTDRSQGGTSLNSGQMEVMVHRRLLFDDAFGVGEALNEMAYGKGLVVRGKFHIIHSVLESEDCDFTCQHRMLAQELLLQPLIAFSSSPNDVFQWRNSTVTKKSGLSMPLPPNLHLLTLEPREPEGEWLCRIEHFFEKGENSKYSKIAKIDFKDLFSDWTVTSVQEMTLGANKCISESKSLQWRLVNEEHVAKEPLIRTEEDNATVFSFHPMEIRTFLLKVISKKQF